MASPQSPTSSGSERFEAPVLVAGGGIAGLAAAAGLRRAGVPVVVFERSPELLAIGGAIQIWANGMRALDELGLSDRIRDAAMPIEVQSFRSWRGAELVAIPTGELARKNGIDPPMMLRRGDLLAILAEGAGAETIRFGTECVGFEQDESGVTVSLSDGRSERGAALVGADGLDSPVRRALFPDAAARFAGYQYLRVLSQFDDFPQGVFTFTFGRGDRFGAHDVSPGWLYWFGVLVNEPESGDPPQGRKAELLERFGGFPPPIPQIIEATPEDDILRTDIRHLPPLSKWTVGRVTLAGDAAHATTPNLGRGAGEALEDAVAIARHLADGGDGIPAALRAYEQERRDAAASVQRRSLRIGSMLSRKNPLFVRARDALFSRVIGPGIVRSTAKEFAELGASKR